MLSTFTLGEILDALSKSDVYNIVFAFTLLLLGMFFFLSYFLEGNQFFRMFMKFAIVTSLYKTDKRRVFVFAVLLWGLAFFLALEFYANNWHP